MTSQWRRHLTALLLTSLSCASAWSESVHTPQSVRLCISCHVQPEGTKESNPDSAFTPLLFGQEAQYLREALHAYATRKRDAFFMRGIAAGLTADQLEEVVRYFSTGSENGSLSFAKLPTAAVRCVACHAPGGGRPIDAKTPVLAGQNAEYLKKAFLAYVEGSRKNEVMQSQAKRADGSSTLTEDELGAIAEWFSKQRPGLRRD